MLLRVSHKKQTGESVKIEISVSLNSRTAILKEVIVFSVEHTSGSAKGLHNAISDCTPIKTSLLIRSSPILTKGQLFRSCVSLHVAQNANSKTQIQTNCFVMSTHTDFFLPHQATFSQTHLMLEQHLPPVILMFIVTSLTSHIPCDLPLSFLPFLSSTVRNFPSSTTSSALLVSIVSLRPPVLPVRPSLERLVHYSFKSASLSNLALDFSYKVTIISEN